MVSRPWYRRYAELREEVKNLRAQTSERLEELGANVQVVREDYERDMLARMVRESNWQEGYLLDEVRTRELSDAAFGEAASVAGPRLDIVAIVQEHRRRVLRLKRAGASTEEIATVNLTWAHLALTWVGRELSFRQQASLLFSLREFKELIPQHVATDAEVAANWEHAAAQLISRVLEDERPVSWPLTPSVLTAGELSSQLLQLKFEDLLHPMKVDYLHFLHRLTTMGLIKPEKCGAFRRRPVHIPARPDLFFPSPSVIPQLVEEFCFRFPTILPSTVTYDPISEAARASHAFVSIHPYADGNGRLSRLLMNLILWRRHHLPVVLKADKEGRHRYVQALRRADRGNIEPLACLISLALIDGYRNLLHTIRRRL